MNLSISIPAAAELCGVGEPAIRRAIREGRIKPAFFWHVGRSNVATYLNLDSVIETYGADETTVEALVRKWTLQAPIVRTPDGVEWLLLDQTQTMMFREGAN